MAFKATIEFHMPGSVEVVAPATSTDHEFLFAGGAADLFCSVSKEIGGVTYVVPAHSCTYTDSLVTVEFPE